MFWPVDSLWYIGGSFVSVFFLLFAGEWVMTFLFSGQLQTYFLNTPILSTVFDGLVSGRLGRFMESRGVLPTIQFAYRKSLFTEGHFQQEMPFCVWHTPFRMLWRWGWRPEWFRSTSVLLSTESAVKRFSLGSALLGLEVKFCLF